MKNTKEPLILSSGRLLTVEQVMALLGYSDSTTFWQAVRRAGIPFVRISAKRSVFRERDLEAWMDARTVAPIPHHRRRQVEAEPDEMAGLSLAARSALRSAGLNDKRDVWSVLGEGDVPKREIAEILGAHHPDKTEEIVAEVARWLGIID